MLARWRGAGGGRTASWVTCDDSEHVCVDACGFDPGTGEAFASCGDGTLTVVKETLPGKFEATQKAQTRRGARTMALDATTHTVYLPTAEFEPAKQGERRPAAKKDSFMVVVVTRG